MQAHKINQSGAPKWPSVTFSWTTVSQVLRNGHQSRDRKWSSVRGSWTAIRCSEMAISRCSWTAICHMLLNGHQSRAPERPSVTCSEMAISHVLWDDHQSGSPDRPSVTCYWTAISHVLLNGHQSCATEQPSVMCYWTAISHVLLKAICQLLLNGHCWLQNHGENYGHSHIWSAQLKQLNPKTANPARFWTCVYVFWGH